MKILRRVLFVLAAVAVLAGVLLFAAKRYLQSSRAARQVAARLEAVYGGPVHLEEVDVGARGSTLRGLRLYEAGADRSATPWLTVEDTEADVSAWDLLKGETLPHRLTVSGAKLLLRFDKEGHLLTQLPRTGGQATEWPAVHIEQSQVTIHQEGRPEMMVHGLSADLNTQDDRLVLTGGVVDATWGNWSLNGSLAPGGKSGSATLKAGRMHITQAMLNDLPLISPRIWQEVQAEGDTPVELRVQFDSRDPKKENVHYRVALEPTHTTVHVPSIELIAYDARGGVNIQDGVVQLRNVYGQAADGDIQMNGDLDFAREPNKLTFAVRAQKLVVEKLPRSWALPAQIEGRLTGEANLQIIIVDGHARTSGTGQGVIEDARIAGQPAEPIGLELHAAPNGYRFASRQPLPQNQLGAKLVLATNALADPLNQPTPPTADQDTFLPSQAVNWVMSNTLHGLEMLVQTGQQVMGYLQKRPDAAPKPDQPPRYLEANLAMKNVNLEQFIQRLKLKLPFPVTGRLTFEVHAAIPIDTPRDLKTYRLNGSATAPQLTLSSLELAHLKAQVAFTNGVLRLEEFRGEVPAGAQPATGTATAGSFDGTARLQLAPQGDVTARLNLQNIPLARVLSLVPGQTQQAQGQISGTFEFLTVAAKLGDVEAWKASGALSSKRVQAFGWALENASSNFLLERGIVALTKARGTLEGTPVTATGTLGLTRPFRYRLEGESLGGTFELNGKLPSQKAPPVPPADKEGRLKIQGVRLSRLGEALGIPGALEPLHGFFNLEMSFRHELPDWVPMGEGRFTLDRLRWGTTELSPRIQGSLHLNREELRLFDLTGSLGGGSPRGQVAFNLRQPERSWFNLALDQGEAARLLAPWPAVASRVEGSVDFHFRGSLGRAWHGAGRILLANARIAGIPVNEWRLPLDFAFVPARGRGEVVVRDSSAELAMGRATGEATWSWGGGTRLDGHIRFTNIHVQTLMRQLADTGQGGLGQVSGRLNFAGENVRSLNDVTADLDAMLQQTQAQSLPVLYQLIPYIAPGQSTSAMFTSGSLRAHLGGGLIRVQRLSLEGRALKLFLEGTVNLEGRLNLEATATTGQYGVNPNTLRLLGLRLPLAGPLPISVLLQATSALSNRLLHLRVLGTYNHPSIQIEPLSLLTQEAVYFFLNQAGVPLP